MFLPSEVTSQFSVNVAIFFGFLDYLPSEIYFKKLNKIYIFIPKMFEEKSNFFVPSSSVHTLTL